MGLLVCEKGIFPLVDRDKIKPGIMEGNERHISLYPIVLKYLKNSLSGWNIGQFFEKIGKTKVALYALTEFSELVMMDVTNSKNDEVIVNICDKQYEKFPGEYYGKKVIGLSELILKYQKKEIDEIVICSIFHTNAIFDELIREGIDIKDIVSIGSILFSR